MANKQKKWRRDAAALKREAFNGGWHIPGARYGAEAKQRYIRLPPGPTWLLAGLLQRYGIASAGYPMPAPEGTRRSSPLAILKRIVGWLR